MKGRRKHYNMSKTENALTYFRVDLQESGPSVKNGKTLVNSKKSGSFQQQKQAQVWVEDAILRKQPSNYDYVSDYTSNRIIEMYEGQNSQMPLAYSMYVEPSFLNNYQEGQMVEQKEIKRNWQCGIKNENEITKDSWGWKIKTCTEYTLDLQYQL